MQKTLTLALPLQKAEQLLKENKRSVAAQTVKEYLRENRSDPNGWYMASLVVDGADKQVGALQQALKLDSQHPQALARLATLQGAPPAPVPVTPIPVPTFAIPEPLKPRFEDTAPSAPVDILARSRQLIADDQYRTALDELSQYLQTNPGNLCAWAERAQLHMRLGQNANMASDIDYVLRQSPRSAADYAAQGLALAIKGFTGPIKEAHKVWSQGEKAFAQARRLDPNCADVYRYRAQSYLWQDKKRESLADLDQAIRLAPRDPQLYWSRAVHRRELGDKRGALQDMDKLVELQPNCSRHYEERQGYRDESDQAGQLSDLNRAIELDPYNIKALNSRSLLYWTMDNVPLALQDLEQILRVDPGNDDARTLRDALLHKEPDNSQRALDPAGNRSSAGFQADPSLVSQPGNPGIGAFILQYWLAFFWLGVALAEIVMAALILLTNKSAPRGYGSSNLTAGITNDMITFLLIAVAIAFYKALRRGVRLANESKSFTNKVAIWAIQLVFNAVVFPFTELYFEIRFLLKARQAWNQNQHLVNEKGKPMRSA